MNANELARTLNIQYGFITWVFGQTLDGLSEQDSLKSPQPAGNCINWVVGHILDSRAGTLKILGMEAPFPADKYGRYGRGSAPVAPGEDTSTLADMVADFNATGQPLQRGLGNLTDEMLAAPAPFSPGDNPKETVGSLLTGLVFHESYHVGQLGILRRLTGADSVIK